jgi:ferritin-like metal-binding protein YciE
MWGLVGEAQHEIEEHDGDTAILDLVIVAGMQRIEHYEIAAYGTGIAVAKALGEEEVAESCSQRLSKKKSRPISSRLK